MEYEEEFERSFMLRTLKIVQEYAGPYDATLLLNCLLGLLIVPRQAMLDRVPNTPLADIQTWGISPSAVQSFGKGRDPTLRGLVLSLRNSVAHFRFRPQQRNGTVSGFRFHDTNGFKARISLKEMREFVEKLTAYLGE
jgi:hypothetical protein